MDVEISLLMPPTAMIIGYKFCARSWKYRMMGMHKFRMKRIMPTTKPFLPNCFYRVSV